MAAGQVPVATGAPTIPIAAHSPRARSMNQVLPYLRLVAAGDATLARLVKGLVRRQAFYVALDPHANAFSLEKNDPSPNAGDSTYRPSYLGTQTGGMGPCVAGARACARETATPPPGSHGATKVHLRAQVRARLAVRLFKTEPAVPRRVQRHERF